ncbi:MAG: arginine--tRNA ligase [Opitutaceae bacterium]|nr:arginine--tRNA ligase [Cytophagales bacterium]
MNLEHQLTSYVLSAFEQLWNINLNQETISFQETKKEFEGTHTLVCFPLTKFSKLSPELTGDAIGKYLVEHVPFVTSYNVVKGFLNLTISDTFWIDSLKSISQTANYGFGENKNELVIVEYSSPNTNKPLHLGHLRNNFLGYSVAEILEASGYKVIRNNLVNDRGIHICKSMLAYQKFGNGETPESSGLKGDHLVGKYYVIFDQNLKAEAEKLKLNGFSDEEIEKQNPLLKEAQEMLLKWEEGDNEVRALWQKMNTWVYAGFEETYNKIGVKFDKYYYESNTYLLGKEVVEEGLKSSVFFKKDNGSVWIDLKEEGLDEKLVLRSDGTSVYITQDLGTADLKYNDFQFAKSIYVVGNEQDYHFKVLQAIMKKLGRPYAEGIYHLSYGMVDLPSGKMKSREGTVVDADDLVSEMLQTAETNTRELGKVDDFTSDEANKLYHTLGLGALKYFLLKVDPKKRMLFDPQESVQFQGNTGPFIQYTHARIRAILRKADEIGIHTPLWEFERTELLPVEKDVIVWINKFPQILKDAGEKYSPAEIANYVYELAKEYNRLYQEVSIFNEPNMFALKSRLLISYVTGNLIKTCMKLLGIDVPERM